MYSGPIAKRMTAEEFTDALWQLTDTGPANRIRALRIFSRRMRKQEHKSYRAALVACDPLMRSLGRPNREQVVSDRPSMLTTLEALDLSNSDLLATTLNRGAPNVLKQFADQDAHFACRLAL